jgi:hypothetical protein
MPLYYGPGLLCVGLVYLEIFGLLWFGLVCFRDDVRLVIWIRLVI